MDRLHELRDKQGRLARAGDEILEQANKEGWTDELNTRFDETHKDLTAVAEMITKLGAMADVRADIAETQGERLDVVKYVNPGIVDTVKKDLEDGGPMKRFFKYCREGFDNFTVEERTLYAAECRAIGTSPDTAGGFLVPEEMLSSITEAILAFGGMRQSRSTIMQTRSGNPLTIPQNDDTGNTGEIIAENAAANELDPVFAEQVLGAFKYSSGIVRVSIELLQDNEIDNFEGFLGNMLGTRIGRKQNTDFTLGVGTTEPEGVVPNSSLGATAAAAAIAKDDIIDLIHGTDPGYSPNAEFMMNYATLGELRKLDTTEGLPIWNSLEENTPTRLYGHPIIVNQDMVDVAPTSIPILFGDFSLYIIREVFPIRVSRTTERYWEFAQVGLMALARADGLLNDAGTGPVRHLIMPV